MAKWRGVPYKVPEDDEEEEEEEEEYTPRTRRDRRDRRDQDEEEEDSGSSWRGVPYRTDETGQSPNYVERRAANRQEEDDDEEEDSGDNWRGIPYRTGETGQSPNYVDRRGRDYSADDDDDDDGGGDTGLSRWQQRRQQRQAEQRDRYDRTAQYDTYTDQRDRRRDDEDDDDGGDTGLGRWRQRRQQEGRITEPTVARTGMEDITEPDREDDGRSYMEMAGIPLPVRAAWQVGKSAYRSITGQPQPWDEGQGEFSEWYRNTPSQRALRAKKEDDFRRWRGSVDEDLNPLSRAAMGAVGGVQQWASEQDEDMGLTDYLGLPWRAGVGAAGGIAEGLATKEPVVEGLERTTEFINKYLEGSGYAIATQPMGQWAQGIASGG
ncbi:MAG: hypothetical protein ACYSW8_32330, partial [Planctomycetota bacterium]